MAPSLALKKLFRLFRALVFAEMVIKKKGQKGVIPYFPLTDILTSQITIN